MEMGIFLVGIGIFPEGIGIFLIRIGIFMKVEMFYVRLKCCLLGSIIEIFF